jgi:hypothetical protein
MIHRFIKVLRRDWINMTREIRNRIATAILALCPASFVILLWLFFAYFSSHPRQPHPELGLVYALNNHGSYVFISAIESTGLALLVIVFIVSFFAAFVIVPKQAILAPTGAPQWITRISGQFKTDLSTPTRLLVAIFCCALICYLAIIYFSGPFIAEFMVSHGVIMHL